MKTMTIEKIPTVNLRREDFSAYGLSLEIWEALTEGMPINTSEVEVKVVRRVA